MNIHASSIQSKWFGDTGKLVTAVFTLAWKLQPCIIFIGLPASSCFLTDTGNPALASLTPTVPPPADEVDAMLGKRTGQEHDAVTTIKTEFMQLWDGFVTRTAANVMVNIASELPHAPGMAAPNDGIQSGDPVAC